MHARREDRKKDIYIEHCPNGNRFSAIKHEMWQRKRDTTRNISCSILFSSTFHGISRKFGLLFGPCGGKRRRGKRQRRERGGKKEIVGEREREERYILE